MSKIAVAAQFIAQCNAEENADDMQSRQSALSVQHKPPSYPSWPTSHPGPLAVQPGIGERPINELRSEQMMEVGYNQETGEPAAQDQMQKKEQVCPIS